MAGLIHPSGAVGCRRPRWVRTRALGSLLLAGCVALLPCGCAGGAGVRRAAPVGTERGAEGDREVADGPGLFTGEKGAVEFDLQDLLQRAKRRQLEDVDEDDGPE